MIIGGEHIFSPAFLFEKQKGYINSLENTFKSDYHINYTFGGYYSLMLILNNLNLTKGDEVLIPSYLCPSIVNLFKLKKIKASFYKVDEELIIDNDFLISIINKNTKAVLFIDYFGRSQSEHLNPVLEKLTAKNISIIQDTVQCLEIKKENLFGDYIFNSFRKFFPFEGSILLSKKQIINTKSKSNHTYLFYKRFGQYFRYIHLKYNFFSSKVFLFFLKKSEAIYYKDYVVKMPAFNRKNLNKYDIDLYIKHQRHYFDLLTQEFNFETLSLLKNDNYIPMGYVIKLKNRDSVRNNLFNNNIFPPIHWKLNFKMDKNIFRNSIDLSEKILTIPLTGLTDEKYIYLIENLKKYI